MSASGEILSKNRDLMRLSLLNLCIQIYWHYYHSRSWRRLHLKQRLLVWGLAVYDRLSTNDGSRTPDYYKRKQPQFTLPIPQWNWHSIVLTELTRIAFDFSCDTIIITKTTRSTGNVNDAVCKIVIILSPKGRNEIGYLNDAKTTTHCKEMLMPAEHEGKLLLHDRLFTILENFQN